jgi:predicted Zn-dependent protease
MTDPTANTTTTNTTTEGTEVEPSEAEQLNEAVQESAPVPASSAVQSTALAHSAQAVPQPTSQLESQPPPETQKQFQTIDEQFDHAIERYRAGEAADTLIPVFKDICHQAPKSSAAWTCLAWLYLLVDKPDRAYKAAKQAVKINPQDPQARINLAVAMLETKQKGVRSHVELVQQIVLAVEELRTEVEDSFADGLQRKPSWKSLEKVRAWIFE